MTAENRDETGRELTTSPLFAPYLKGNETCYAEHVRYVKISICEEDDNGSEVRSLLKQQELPLKINAFKHTDQDIVDEFEPGRYWVEAVRAVAEGKEKPGTRMPGGHYVNVADTSGGEERDPRAGMDGYPPPHMVPRSSNDGTVVAAAIQSMQKSTDKLVDVALSRSQGSSIDDAVKILDRVSPRQDTPVQIKTLNDNLDELRRLLRKAEEKAAEDLAEEKKRARNDLDDAKREARAAVEKAEKAADERIREVREDNKRQQERWDEERKRLNNEIDEMRAKFRRETERMEDDHRKALNRTDEEFARYRSIAEKNMASVEADLLASKRQATELSAKFDMERMDNERLKKEVAQVKKDAAEYEDQIAALEKDLEEAQSAAKSKPPVDGIVGYLLEQVGADGLKAALPLVLSAISGAGGNAGTTTQTTTQQLPATQTATQQTQQTKPQTVRRTVRPAVAPAAAAPATSAPVEDTSSGTAVRVQMEDETVQDDTDETTDEQPELPATSGPTDVEATLEGTGT